MHTRRIAAYEGNVYDIRIMRAWVFLLRRATVASRCPIRATDLSLAFFSSFLSLPAFKPLFPIFSPKIARPILNNVSIAFQSARTKRIIQSRSRTKACFLVSIAYACRGKIYQRAFYGLLEVERRTGALPSRYVSLFPPSFLSFPRLLLF